MLLADEDHKDQGGDHGHADASQVPPPPAGTEPGGSVDGADAVGPEATTPTPPPRVFSDANIEGLVDMVLKMHDKNDDGYVEYYEFRMYRKEVEKKAQGQKEPQQQYWSPFLFCFQS